MISTLTSPSFVNRVQESWQAGYGVTQSSPVSGGPFTQAGFTLDMNFAAVPQQNFIWVTDQGLTAKTFSQIVTFTRASTATYFDSTGTLQTAAVDGPRFDYDPTTLACKGLLIEEQRTNSIRNNTMQGAVAGTPGTLPTNWGFFTALTGLAREVVSTGIEGGINYVDIRISGTPSGPGTFNYYTETGTAIAASVGQTWAASVYFKLQAGSLAGVTATRLYLQENSSGGGYLVEQNFAVPSPTGAPLVTQRSTANRTLANASVAFVQPGFNFILSGAAVDFTLRIGFPQLELGAFATSVIPTTTAAATRAADVAVIQGANFSNWYNQSEGTFVTVVDTASNSQNGGIIGLDDGTTANLMRSFIGGVTPVFTITNATVTQAYLTPSPLYSVGVANKVASAYAANDFASVSSGGAVAVDSLGTSPTILNRALIGSGVAGVVYLNGHIARITYYPRRLTNVELQTVTA